MEQDIAMKHNRRIFPLYKAISWDALFYYAIIFLFLTETKGLSASTVLYAEAVYTIFLLIFQIPATILIERLGSKKALVLGNILVAIQIASMIFASSFIYLILVYSMRAFGYALKGTAQYTLLYNSIKSKEGKNSFANIDAKYQDKIHATFKNKSLAFISIPVFISFIIIGLITISKFNYATVIIIVVLGFAVQYFLRAPYWTLNKKYVTNFTNSDIRTKIISASELIESLGTSIITFLAGLLLAHYNTNMAYLIIGIVGTIAILLVLSYMKTRFGLNPEDYSKEDIKYSDMK